MERETESGPALEVMDILLGTFPMIGERIKNLSLEERAGIKEVDLKRKMHLEETTDEIIAERKIIEEGSSESELFAEIVDANKMVARSEIGIDVSNESILEGLTSGNAFTISRMAPLKLRKRTEGSLRQEVNEENGQENVSIPNTVPVVEQVLNKAPISEQVSIAKNKTTPEELPVPEKVAPKKTPFPDKKATPEQVEIPKKTPISDQVAIPKNVSTQDKIPVVELQDSPPQVQKNSKSRKSNNYALTFVIDKTTNQPRVIPLGENEQLPSNYELSSNQGPSACLLPNSLISAKTSVSQNPSSEPSNSSKTLSTTMQNGDASVPSTSMLTLLEIPTSDGEESMPLISPGSNSNHSQLENSTRKRKASSDDPVQPNNIELSPVANKHSKLSSNVAKVAVPLERSSAVPSQGATSQSQTSTSRVQISSKPSLSVNPLTTGQNSGSENNANKKRTSATFLQCKLCKEFFPRHSDNLFAKHMFIEHNMDVANNEKYIKDSITESLRLLQCNKCGLKVQNKYEEHRQRCLPTEPSDSAFQDVGPSILNYPVATYSCKIGNCQEVFEMRIELKKHVLQTHTEYASKMIFDPDFRCAKCLKRFEVVSALAKHCDTCSAERPTRETTLELARSFLDCDYCRKPHEELGITTSCYLGKSIVRCVLCLATFKEKQDFITHAVKFHGMEESNGRRILHCPFCENRSDKFTVIYPHIVMDHYGPALVQCKQSNRVSRAPPPKPKPKNTVTPSLTIKPVTKQSGLNGVENPKTNRVTSTAVSAPVPTATNAGNMPRKMPQLQPLAKPVQPVTTVQKIIPSVTTSAGAVGPPRVHPIVVRTTSSVNNAPNKIYLVRTTTASNNRGVPVSIRQPTPVALSVQPRTLLVRPATPQTTSVVSSASLRPVSLVASQTLNPRQPQVQYVRPLPTVASYIIRSVPATMTSQPRVTTTLTNASINSSMGLTSALARATRPLGLTSAQLPVSFLYNRGTAANVIRSSLPGTSLAAYLRAPTSMISSSTTITPANVRAPVRPPPGVSSVLTISAAPAVRNPISNSAKSLNVFSVSPTVSNTSIGNASTGNAASPSATVTPVVRQPQISKPGSKIVTISGRTFEYRLVESKLTSKSQSVTQSASGLTHARHAPPDIFKIPSIPSACTLRPIGPIPPAARQTKPNDSNDPTQNQSSN